MVTRRRPPQRPKLSPAKPADDRRARFIAEYMLDCNAKQAAIRAGYSPASAHTTGYRLLKNADVAAEIAARQKKVEAKLADRYEVNAARITREMALLGYSNVLDFGQVDADGQFRFDMSATTRDEAAALHTVRVKRSRRTIGSGDDAQVVEDVETHFRIADKRAALESMAKMIGMYRDGPDVTVPVTFIVERTHRSAKRREETDA